MGISPSVLVETNVKLRRLGMILANGARSSKSLFPPHNGLMGVLRAAYEKGDAKTFKKTMATYLKQAQGHVPQTATPEEAKELLDVMNDFIDHPQIGFKLVAHYLIRAAQASEQF